MRGERAAGTLVHAGDRDLLEAHEIGEREGLRVQHQSIDCQGPVFPRDARHPEVTEDDCVLDARESVMHPMRGKREAAEELVRIELGAVHGSPFRLV